MKSSPTQRRGIIGSAAVMLLAVAALTAAGCGAGSGPSSPDTTAPAITAPGTSPQTNVANIPQVLNPQVQKFCETYLAASQTDIDPVTNPVLYVGVLKELRDVAPVELQADITTMIGFVDPDAAQGDIIGDVNQAQKSLVDYVSSTCRVE